MGGDAPFRRDRAASRAHEKQNGRGEFGADRILFGTDYPASMSSNRMGDDRGVDTILGVSELSDFQKADILGRNAAQLLGIKS